MNTRKLEADLKRLRTASRYEQRRYELAAARQAARWEVLWHERFTLGYDKLQLDYAEIDGTPPPEPDQEELARVAAAQKLLGEDSDERCARDQEIIEAYHLRRYDHMEYAPVRGRTRDELWTNRLNCLFDPESESVKRGYAELCASFGINGSLSPKRARDPRDLVAQALPDSDF